MHIELNPNQKEKFEFDVALASVPRQDLAEFRLGMIFDDYHIGIQGKYNNGVASFEIPALQDYISGIENKKTLPFYLEFIYEEYLTRIYENEFDLISPFKAEIQKITHIKQEPVKEENQKPIKVEEKIKVKKSQFRKGFEVFVNQKK
jgi:hypothetical protein